MLRDNAQPLQGYQPTTKATLKRQRIGMMELFGVGGFSFHFGYALLSFFWFYADFPPGYDGFHRGVAQAFVFIGIPVTFLGIRYLHRAFIGNSNYNRLLPAFFILALIAPCLVLLFQLGIHFSLPVYAFGGLTTGIAGAYFTLRWLDGCGSARVHKYLRFTSAGIFGGGVLFLLANLTAPLVQPVFAMIYLIASSLLLVFLQARTGRDDELVIKSRKELLPFAKEVEPPIFVYGVVFGLGFALMFIQGGWLVLAALSAILLGAGVVFLLDFTGAKVGITISQRVLLVVTVAACLIIPFGPPMLKAAGICLIVASWAAFNAINWALLVQRGVSHKAFVFFSIASGASVSTFGFLLGWLIALVYAYTGFSELFLTPILLLLVFLLVFVVMLFYPESRHHGTLETIDVEQDALQVPANEIGEKALFRMRCEKVAELYHLSPREQDVLNYLARGRNANYIQKELCVSSHTAKSHIYNIYRKLDIHSQQKLMDFIEEYPVEVQLP
ncbi:MAG: helix-turn-helix transcriptional regulator [Coriobacteriales bacterium]|jgi:DNA-binding CsgD family transcriptional regulator|nr:helix-turn-helix transcriptional regulator [Coriobacteriales bacterium]